MARPPSRPPKLLYNSDDNIRTGCTVLNCCSDPSRPPRGPVMTAAASPSPVQRPAILSDPHSAVIQVFGGRPFHTDGDLLTLAFAADGTLWSLEEPSVLRHWDLATGQQLGWRQLDDEATVWKFSPGADLLAGGRDVLGLWE